MTFVNPKDRVAETASGTGPFTLLGALDASYDALSASMANGDTTYGCVVEPGVAFAAGILTYNTTGPAVSITTMQSSKGTFGGGTKLVFQTFPSAETFTIGAGLINSTNVLLLDPSFIQNYLAGLTLSNDGVAPNTKIDVAAGVAANDTNAAFIKLAAGAIDCTTTGANGLDTGSLAASKWYHAWAISKADGTSATFANRDDLTGLSPTLPSTYIYKRRIGSFKTDASSHILAFSQLGNEFRLAASVLEVSSGTGDTTAHTVTLTSVPTGVKMIAILSAGGAAGAANDGRFTISSLDQTDEAAAASNSNVGAVGAVGTQAYSQLRIGTNTSAQIRYRAFNANGTIFIGCRGWVDYRGQ